MRKYLVATAIALLVAVAIWLDRPEVAFGGEWLLPVMVPGWLWVWEDLR